MDRYRRRLWVEVENRLRFLAVAGQNVEKFEIEQGEVKKCLSLRQLLWLFSTSDNFFVFSPIH